MIKAMPERGRRNDLYLEIQGVSDNLVTSMGDLLSNPLPAEAVAAQQRDHVTYHLSLLDGDANIILLESRFLISGSGTTGLRTWEAALHMGQYLCANPSFVQGKRVLELGTGTGYIAVLCAKYLGSEHVIATDGSEDVVSNLPDNFFVNELEGSGKVTASELKWGQPLMGTKEPEWNGERKIDVVIGADITYDVSVIPALVETLEELAELSPGVAILIAATERNRATFESFLEVCKKREFNVSYEEFPVLPRKEQRGPFYSDLTPIHSHSWSIITVQLPKRNVRCCLLAFSILVARPTRTSL